MTRLQERIIDLGRRLVLAEPTFRERKAGMRRAGAPKRRWARKVASFPDEFSETTSEQHRAKALAITKKLHEFSAALASILLFVVRTRQCLLLKGLSIKDALILHRKNKHCRPLWWTCFQGYEPECAYYTTA